MKLTQKMINKLIDKIIYKLDLIIVYNSKNRSLLKNLLKDTVYTDVRNKVWLKLGNTLGKDTYINNSISLIDTVDLKHNVYLGERVALAPNITFITCSSPNNSILKNGDSGKRYGKTAPIIIGDDTWIGTNCTIQPGIKIGKCCIIGSMSNVTKDIPDYSIAYGNPVKIIRSIDKEISYYAYSKNGNICRARPKYLNQDFIKEMDTEKIKENKNIFYFNSASSAAFFFFNTLRLLKKKELKIGIQSFTCSTMFDAICESRNKIYLFDVKKQDCSISYEEIKQYKNLDILIITHYQGIPNHEYEQIVNFCKENSILVFEDCSHGCNSKINNIRIGSLGNCFIESYNFDKPFTCCSGGSLTINYLDENIQHFFNEKYEKLKTESLVKAKVDIKKLSVMMDYTKIENYSNQLDYFLFKKHIVLTLLYKPKCRNSYLRFLKYISMFLDFFVKEKKVSYTRKLHAMKIELIKKQKKNYFQVDGIPYKNLLENERYHLCFFDADFLDIHWNRYSVIDETPSLLSAKLKQIGVDANNFNWPICLHKKNKEQNVVFCSNFNNSDFLSEHIVNIPNWELVNCKN